MEHNTHQGKEVINDNELSKNSFSPNRTRTRRHFTLDDLQNENIVYITPGHAPSLVSTIGPTGNTNVGVFEQTMLVSYRPPRVLLAIGALSDTYRNIIDGSDCVVGFPRPEFAQIVYDAGAKIPRTQSEVDLVRNLSTFPSCVVSPPSLEQCWISMECTLHSDQCGGDHHLLLLNVVNVSLDEDVWRENKVERRTHLPALYYTTSGNFFTPGRRSRVQLSTELQCFSSISNNPLCQESYRLPVIEK